MPIKHLTKDHKEKLQQGRIRARAERENAKEMIETNDQMINPKFWEHVKFDRLVEIRNTIDEVLNNERSLKIKELEEQLKMLRGE